MRTPRAREMRRSCSGQTASWSDQMPLGTAVTLRHWQRPLAGLSEIWSDLSSQADGSADIPARLTSGCRAGKKKKKKKNIRKVASGRIRETAVSVHATARNRLPLVQLFYCGRTKPERQQNEDNDGTSSRELSASPDWPRLSAAFLGIICALKLLCFM